MLGNSFVFKGLISALLTLLALSAFAIGDITTLMVWQKGMSSLKRFLR